MSDEQSQTNKPPAVVQEGVFLLHGLFHSRLSMKLLARRLEEVGYQVFNFPYISNIGSIKKHAEKLHQAIVANHQGDSRFHLVGHSMGALISRYYATHFSDPRLGRIVMITPPNRPSRLAKLLRKTGVYQLFGKGAQQLSDDTFYAEELPRCSNEVGVIAACRGNGRGYNPLLKGDDDSILTVEETRLAEMRDWVIVHHLHSVVSHFQDTFDLTHRFLKNGSFR